MKLIILAGGGGTRLYPLSRTNFPKQFLNIDSDKSLLGMTLERFEKICKPEDIVIVTGENYINHVKEDLKKNNLEKVHIVAEPCAKNTAPAIALAVKYCMEKLSASLDEVIFVAPADHIISSAEKFIDKAKLCEIKAKDGAFVTMGIKPTKPETGYGYIKVSKKREISYDVECFVEKPDMETAKKYVEDGSYYWNSGMFSFTSKTFIEELSKQSKELYEYMECKNYDEFIKDFPKITSISIDYAIAEKCQKISMIPLDIYWNDVGSWDSLYDHFEKDENGNVFQGDTFSLDCKNSMFISNKRLILGAGVEDIFVVETDDVIMVTKKGDTQKVKNLFDSIKDRVEAHDHSKTNRPWGTYTIISEDLGYKVKKIVVYPGQKLSLQLHNHRSEHWIVINGEASVVIGGDAPRIVRKNESVYVPNVTKHRLMNNGTEDLEIIEVQNGSYTGEDDIERFDDVYDR